MNPSRLVFFLQGVRVPAARARGVTIARALAERGVPVEMMVPRPSVYGDVTFPRWVPFGRSLARVRPLFRPFSLIARTRHVAALRRDDVVLFQRPMIEYPTAVYERWAARGRRSIFDFDDAIYLDFGGHRKLRRIVETVDYVIAGNRALAEVAAAPEKTTVIPTIVDTERFRPLATRPRVGSEVVVGWTGLRGNYKQLLVAKEGIARALEETGARLLLISNSPPPRELATLNPEYRPWRAETELADLSEIDIGVMPLPDTPFARGKCAYKLIQYLALGRPGVASPVGANREVVTDGVDGFLPTSPGAWAESLIALIRDPELRQRVGAAGRRRVEAAYSLAAVLPRYLDIWARLSAVDDAAGLPTAPKC